MGTRSARKLCYAGLLTGALDLTAVPRPLDAVLDHVLPCDVTAPARAT